MRTWYSITASADNSVASLSIYDEIGMWGVNARDFIRDLKSITAPTVEISINSPGGSLFDAVAMFNALRASGKTIVTKVAGVAASAASYILQAGDTRTAPENTFVMVHNPLMGAYGTAEDMREAADILDKVGESMRATYQTRSGMSDEQMAETFATDTWLTAQEALDLGLLDEVTPAIAVSASYEVDRLPENIKALLQGAPKEAPAADVPPATKPYAEQVAEILAAADLSEHAAAFVLRYTTLDAVSAAVGEAREIRALCTVLAKDAKPFIAAGTSLADVRAALLAAQVAADPGEIDNAEKTGGAPAPAQPNAATPSSIWAARNKTH
jgi:ATP-dependent Clp protease protease subunit